MQTGNNAASDPSVTPPNWSFCPSQNTKETKLLMHSNFDQSFLAGWQRSNPAMIFNVTYVRQYGHGLSTIISRTLSIYTYGHYIVGNSKRRLWRPFCQVFERSVIIVIDVVSNTDMYPHNAMCMHIYILYSRVE